MNNIIQLNAKGIYQSLHGVPTSSLAPNFAELVEEKADALLGAKSALWADYAFDDVLGISYADDIAKMALKSSGLDFEVKQVQLYRPSGNGFQPVSVYCNVRVDNEIELGYTGERYELAQNDATLGELTRAIMANPYYNTQPAAGGAMYKGAACFVVLHVENNANIMSEPYDTHIVLVNSFNGSTGVKVVFCATRIACLNALVATTGPLGKDRVFNIRHTASLDARLLEVKKMFADLHKYEGNISRYMEELRKETLSVSEVEEMVKFICGLNKPEDLDTERKLINASAKYSAMMECFNAPDLRDMGLNKFRILQAGMDYASRSTGLRNTKTARESRVARLWKSTPEMERTVLAIAS